MALHNPNNWHWVNKDVRGWTRDYLDRTLTPISAEENGVSAKIAKIVNMDGDVDVSQRKGKVITLYDVQLNLEYEGKTADGEDVTGSIKIPEVAHDTEADEYVFNVENYGDSAVKQPVRDLVRNKITPQLRSALFRLTDDLIAEHRKDLQHSTDKNQTPSGPSTAKNPAPTSTITAAAAKPAAASAPKTTATTTTSTKALVNTTTVSASDEFRTTAEQLYTTFTEPQRISLFTRGPPRVFEGVKPGAKFSIFDGNVNGEYEQLEPPHKLVQKWRLAAWPEGHLSRLEIQFDQNDIDAVTVMRVRWEGVPVGEEDMVRRNWENYYVRSIKQTFGFGTIL